MAKVNLNNGEFEAIQQKIDLAKKALSESAMDTIWSGGFANVKAQLIDSGLLQACYDDAESNYHAVKGAGGIIIGCGTGAVCAGSAAVAVGGVSTGAVAASCGWLAALWPVGTIIAGIIAVACLAIGIVNIVKANKEPEWKYEAKNILEQLIFDCWSGDDVNWYALANLETKFENVRLSLQSVLLHIADFNTTYANLDASANEVGLDGKLALADDGVTVTNINTTINIDGEEVETTVAEAMNAFYTYTSTVTAAEIEAEYLHQKYPDLDINFADIVRNANSFMSSTLHSGLYSKEFVDHILPTYNPDLGEAKDAVTGATGLGLSGLETLLDNNKGLLGDIGLYAGLIGTGFINKPDSGWPEGFGGGDNPDTSSTPDNPTDSNQGNTSDPIGCGGCGSSGPVTPTPTPETTPETPTNDIKLEDIVDTEIPEKELEIDYGMGDKTDYDKLAREAYEYGEGAEEIVKHQQELLDEIERAYEEGNLDAIKEKLKEYGFSGPEIEAIIADKYQCIKTMMYCDKREILAAKAKELALADGVEDYDTMFDDRIDYDKDLAGEGANDLLMLASEDETCVKAYEAVSTSKEAYDKALEEVNPLIKDANDKKKAMEEIKAKYEKEFSSDDSSKWSAEAAKEYNESIKAYNESATTAAAGIATVDAAKTAYQEARTTFEQAQTDYYEKIRNEQFTANEEVSEGSPTEQEDSSSNPSSSDDSVKPYGAPQEYTELTTDNIAFDENGEISFSFGDTGEVQGAVLDTSQISLDNSQISVENSKSTLDTSDIDKLIG